MKTTLLLSLALTIALSIIPVAGLSCCSVEEVNCTSKVCQSNEPYCVSAQMEFSSATSSSTQKIIACAKSFLCPTPGIHVYSLNIKFSSVLAEAFCCNTDNCNIPSVVPTLPTLGKGSLQCISCDTAGKCSPGLVCDTAQGRCFRSNVTNGGPKMEARGCVTQNLCDAAAAAGTLNSSPLLKQFGTFDVDAICCPDNNCNHPGTNSSNAADTGLPYPGCSGGDSSVSSLRLLQVLALALALIF